MSWKKITDGLKEILAPDGKSFIYPTELYVNDAAGEYLFLHEGKYYVITNDTGYKLKFTTNSEALSTKYEDDFVGNKFIAEHCISNNSESLVNIFKFNGQPALTFDLSFDGSGFKTEYCLFFSDGLYRMRLKELCDGRDLKKLYATFYWDAEEYDSTWNYTTFIYPESEFSDALLYANSNNASDVNQKDGDNLILKSSSIDGSMSVDWASNSQQPPSDWLALGEASAVKYYELYTGVAQSEYTISSQLIGFNIYNSNTLTGEYTGVDANNDPITRTVGWLVDGEYVAKNENIYIFTANANKGDMA